jgi:hypothetical protein
LSRSRQNNRAENSHQVVRRCQRKLHGVASCTLPQRVPTRVR